MKDLKEESDIVNTLTKEGGTLVGRGGRVHLWGQLRSKCNSSHRMVAVEM